MSEATTFGDLIKTGAISITDGYRAKNSELGGNGLIFLRAGHVTDAHIDFEGVERFYEKLTSKLQEKISRVGDVIVTTKGNSTGRTSFVDATMPTFVYSPHLSRWRVENPNIVDSGFLRYWSRSPEFVNQMRGLAASTDMAPYLNLRDQQRLQITLPKIDDQRAIGSVLGALDEKIEQNRRTGCALEALARATFKAWFVDFEPVKAKAAGQTSFPGMLPAAFAALPDRLTDSPLGPVPQGWKIGAMGDVGQQRREQIAPVEVEGETPYIGLEHMPRRDLMLSAWGTAASVTSSKFRFRRGDILFGKLRPYFHKVGRAPLDGVCSTDIVVLYSNRPEYAGWLLMLVSGDDFVAHTDRASAGTKMPRTNWKDMAAFPVALPPPPVAAAYEEQVESMLDMIEAGIHESSKLASLRDYLLPRLLSGRVRVRSSLIEVNT
jgi:type I restriction enzyme, S subunit